jgi:hypothetical protein
MTFTAVPTRYEIYDDLSSDEPDAVIEMFDAGCSRVEIKSVQSPTTWEHLSAAIGACLREMHKEIK